MKILLTGGGTLGSVSPLLSVAEEIKKRCDQEKQDLDFLWIGSWHGPQRELVEARGIRYEKVSSGKLRRYFSIHNLWFWLFLIQGVFESLSRILKFKPEVIISAGSYVAVPVIWAGWLLRVPILIHQQDYRPGLANKLSSPFAKKITVAFEKSIKNFKKGRAEWVGNPVRSELFDGDKEAAKKFFHLEDKLLTVLILGGGTGSLKINQLVARAADELTRFCQVIHSTGSGRNVKDSFDRYHVYQLLVSEMKDALAVADVVVSRCGLGTLSELSLLKKPSILIPMPNTHQEDNIRPFIEKGAAVVLEQEKLTSESFASSVKKLLFDEQRKKELSDNIQKVIKPGAAKRISDIVFDIKK